MSLLNSILGALGDRTSQPGDAEAPANPLLDIASELLARNGGVQGLMERFSKGGFGDVFASWVGTGPNQPIQASQLEQALGSDQISGIASKLGIDPQQAIGLLSQLLPGLIDRITPGGQMPATAETPQGIAAMLPDLLKSLSGLQAGEPGHRPPTA